MTRDWDLRTPPEHLVREYFASGWWNDETDIARLVAFLAGQPRMSGST